MSNWYQSCESFCRCEHTGIIHIVPLYHPRGTSALLKSYTTLLSDFVIAKISTTQCTDFVFLLHNVSVSIRSNYHYQLWVEETRAIFVTLPDGDEERNAFNLADR